MDIVIIGAGVFGSWTALLCARAGHHVTLLDQRGPANSQSSSAGESRIIRSAYGNDEIYTRMARRSLHLWHEFLREENHEECFQRTGVLWMARAEEPSIWQVRAIFNRMSLACEWLDASGISERYPQFEIPGDTVAIFEPDAGALLADRCVNAVMTAALRDGVHYEQVPVKPPPLHESHLRSIETTDGRHFAADCFLFACGSWLPKLFDAIKRVLRPTRQEVFFFEIPGNSPAFRPGAFPIWIDQAESNIAYGFPDLGNGLKMGFHRLGPAFDPDLQRSPVGDQGIVAAQEYFKLRIPALAGAALKSGQICHYENTPNGDFLIDRPPGVSNVWWIGGGSGHGFKHAPAVAEYVVDAINGTGRKEPRFGLAGKQHAIGGRVL